MLSQRLIKTKKEYTTESWWKLNVKTSNHLKCEKMVLDCNWLVEKRIPVLRKYCKTNGIPHYLRYNWKFLFQNEYWKFRKFYKRPSKLICNEMSILILFVENKRNKSPCNVNQNYNKLILLKSHKCIVVLLFRMYVQKATFFQ